MSAVEYLANCPIARARNADCRQGSLTFFGRTRLRPLFHQGEQLVPVGLAGFIGGEEIGRASCRERVCQYVSLSVVAVSLKTKTKTHTLSQQTSHKHITH